MKNTLLILNALLYSLIGYAQSAYKIEVEIKDAQAPEIYLAYHFGSKQYITDTATMVGPGKYIFEGEEALKGGIYLVAMPPTNRYFELLITPEEQNLSIQTDTVSYGLGMQIEGSTENSIFYEYISHLADQRKKAQEMQMEMQNPEATDEQVEAFEKQLMDLNNAIKDYQSSLIEQHDGKFVAALIKANQEITIPEVPEGADPNFRLYYYRDRYFDNIDFDNELMLRTPVLEKKMKDYLDRLVVKAPDSIIAGVDHILEMAYAGENEEVTKFAVSVLLNEYANSKIMGMDAIYVHIAQKYYGSSQKTPWVEAEQRKKIIDNANRLAPILIGKTAPDFTIPQLDGKRISLHNTKAKYTILYFWDPDCGTCTKTSKKLVEVYDKYKAHGVEIFGVCNKAGDELGKCAEKVAKTGIKWINTADLDGSSQVHAKYYVTSNPLIFVLDENKIIRFKRLDAEQLVMVLDRELGLEKKEATE